MTLVKRAFSNLQTKDPNRERVPVGPRAVNAGFVGSGIQNTQLALMNTYGTVGWLFAVVDRIAQATASVKWELWRRMPNGDQQEIFEHPALTLWNNVSPFDTGDSFREAGQQHLELTGEWWILLIRGSSGLPEEMQLLRPDRIRPIPHPEEFISGYRYQLGSFVRDLEPTDVIQIKHPSPLDVYRGMGPVQALLTDLDVERFASQWVRQSFLNGAEPGGIVITDDGLDQDEFDTMVRRWEEQHKGVGNANRVAFLERATWVDRKLTQRDMQFEQLRKLNRQIIAGAFGMPEALLGVSEGINRSNAEAAELMFSRWVIKPRLDRNRSALNTKLLPLFDPTGTLFFDYQNPVPRDRQTDIAEGSSGYSSGILTLNEARRRFGEGEVEEGDEFKPGSSGGGGLFQLGMQKGMTKNDPLLAETIEREERAVRRNWRRRLNAEAEGLTAFIELFFNREAHGIQTKIELSDIDSFDWDWWTRYGPEVIAELEKLFIASMLFDAPDMVLNEVQRLAAEYANVRGARLLRLDGDMNIAEATRRRVRTVVASSIENGDSLNTLQKTLREDHCFSAERAQLVARTETGFALGEGQKQIAISQGRDEKSWVTQGTNTVDQVCLDNESQGWIAMVDSFLSGHDTVPAHPGCQCVVRYRTAEGTRVDPTEGLEEDVAGAISGARMVDEIRCPKCDQRQTVSQFKGAGTFYCTRCKKTFSFSTIEEGLHIVRKTIERDAQNRIIAITEERPL